MLMICFDILAMAVILWFFDKEEASDTFNLALTVVLNTIMTFVVALVLVPKIGALAVVPMLGVSLLLIRWRFTLTWGKTVGVLVLFYAAKVIFTVVLDKLMTTSVQTP